jgi:hypothetical protein
MSEERGGREVLPEEEPAQRSEDDLRQAPEAQAKEDLGPAPQGRLPGLPGPDEAKEPDAILVDGDAGKDQSDRQGQEEGKVSRELLKILGQLQSPTSPSTGSEASWTVIPIESVQLGTGGAGAWDV